MPQATPLRMDKQAEERLLTAVRTVSSAVEGGMDPTSAVIKVARDQDLGRNMVPLVVQAYNVGRTNWQQENNSNILDKQASFPIARLEDAIAELYPSEVMTPAEEKAASAVSSVYSQPPKGRPSDDIGFEKAARAVDIRMPEDQRPETLDPHEKLSYKVDQAFGSISKEKRAMEAAATRERNAKVNYLASLGAIRDYFKQSSYIRKPFAEVEHNARLLFGDPGVYALNYAYESNRMKEARAQGPPRYLSMATKTSEPYSLIDQAIQCGRELLDSHRALRRIEKEAEEKIGGALRPFSQTPSHVSIIGGKPIQSSASGSSKEAGFLGNLAMLGTGSAIRGASEHSQSPDAMVEEAESALSDPEHMAELRSIETKAMLQNLINNDEVISGYDPEEVIMAYNEISQLTPRAASQTAIIRPLLRKRLTQGAMEPFEAQQMADIEKTLGQMGQMKDETITPNKPLQSKEDSNVLSGNTLLN